MWWLYLATALVVVFLVLVRGLTFGFRPARAPRSEDAARPERAARPQSPRAGEPANA
jgi:hypothetical protein